MKGIECLDPDKEKRIELDRTVQHFYSDIWIMMWVHFSCFSLYIIKKLQKTLQYYGAYTKVAFAWAYTYIYAIGVLFVTFKARLWRQLQQDFETGKRDEITKEYRGLYHCMVWHPNSTIIDEDTPNHEQRLFNHETDRVIN